MSGETYNGWANYPTQAMMLWLWNAEDLYNATRELAVDHAPHRIDLADALSTWVRDDLTPDLSSSFAADLLGYALDQVDWLKIADAWLEDVGAVPV